MSRGVKDLRELICVSRLTIRASDEEYNFSDEDGRISRFTYASFSTSSGPDSRQSSAKSLPERGKQMSPDSGIGTNGISPESIDHHDMKLKENTKYEPHPPAQNKKKNKKKKKKNQDANASELMYATHELPRPKPLPPLRTDSYSPSPSVEGSNNSTISSETDETPIHTPTPPVSANKKTVFPKVRNMKGSSMPSKKPPQTNIIVNFDFMLTYTDATLVAEWLSYSNCLVSEMTQWCQEEDNFVRFSHFWLSEMPSIQRQEILKLEYSILMDQFQLAFSAGKDAGEVKYKELVHFTQAVFKEYPAKLFSAKGSHVFLDYLEVLTSEKTVEYKKLLSDVRCSTKIKQYAQWTLACRAYSLVSVWSAVVKFYRKIQSSKPQPLPSCSVNTGDSDPNQQRMYQAIRLANGSYIKHGFTEQD